MSRASSCVGENRSGSGQYLSAQRLGLDHFNITAKTKSELYGLLFDIESQPDANAISLDRFLLKPPAAITRPTHDRRVCKKVA